MEESKLDKVIAQCEWAIRQPSPTIIEAKKFYEDTLEVLKSQQAKIERLKERVPKKGEWLQTDKPDITAAWHPHCSVCGKEVTNHYAFCPFCGTDMRDSYEYISNMT